MKRADSNPFLLNVSRGLLGLLLLAMSHSVRGSLARWDFDVFLNDKRIGEHFFILESEQGQLVLRTEASFEVKILFFTAFQYAHSNEEIWDKEGLVRIDAETDSNGKQFSVTGNRTEEGFLLETLDGTSQLPDRVMTFAYWNPQILSAQRLLNSQTGEYLDVEIRENGPDTILYNETPLETIRYDILIDEAPISLWYSKTDGRWVALQSAASGGKKIRYVPRQIPESVNLSKWISAS